MKYKGKKHEETLVVECLLLIIETGVGDKNNQDTNTGQNGRNVYSIYGTLSIIPLVYSTPSHLTHPQYFHQHFRGSKEIVVLFRIHEWELCNEDFSTGGSHSH